MFDSVSIIIATKDRADHLESTLQSIADARNPDHLEVELLVIDNGSTDNTAAVARQIRVPVSDQRVVCEPRQGLSYARNRALTEARGDLLLWTDDDVRVPENWIEGMTRPIRKGEADAVAGGVRLAPHLERSWMQQWHRAFLASSERIEKEPVNDMVGANMCFGRHVLDKVPRFDTRVGPGALGFSGESTFAQELWNAGFHIAPAFDIVVEHHFDPSRLLRSSFLSSARKLGRSMGYLHHTHFPERSTAPDGPFRPYLELLELKAKLSFWRLVLQPERTDEGPPVSGWEKYYVRRIAYLQQTLQERGSLSPENVMPTP
jgi:glycosyltransferase involved in cell wall biosynthesis